jgi:anti-sigma B factor antagonist
VEFEVRAATEGGCTVLSVDGELDIATASELEVALDAALAAQAPLVVVDLTTTEFIDSTACRLLSSTSKLAASRSFRFEIVCPDDNWNVHRVLDMIGIPSVVPVRAHLGDVSSTGSADRTADGG